MASTAAKLSLLYRTRNTLTWNAVMASLNLAALWNMRQTAGTNEPNEGSLGSALNLTLTSVTLGQTGKLGANEAYLLDGASSRMQVVNNPTLAGYLAWEYFFLVNPTSSGEITTGRFFTFNSSVAAPFLQFNSTLSSLLGRVFNTSATAAATTTTTGLTAGLWAVIFVSYDDAGDRKLHIRKGVGGAVSEFGYSSNQAVTGTYLAPDLHYILGNDGGQARTWDGLFDAAGVKAGNLTDAERLLITQTAGV